MKLSHFFQCVITVLILLTPHHLLAQDIKGGTVKYKNISRYDFQTLFAPWADRAKDWVASLPTESEGYATLAFSEKSALYDTKRDEQILPKRLKDAQAKAAFMRGPATEINRVFYDFGKNEIVRQVDFMGRLFLVADEIKAKPWKLTNKMTKILDYTCMSAELEQDGKSIIAYFTSEIPFSIGPDEFFGLPGLILAVEVDGKTAFLAQSIELTPPAKDAVAGPKEGKQVTQEKFDSIVAEKTKEYNETKYEGKKRK